MLLRRFAAPVIGALALAAAAGCGGEGPGPACEISAGAEAVIVYATEAGELRDLVDGAEVPLIAAPQGGHILLIAARVRGVTGCSINVNAAVRDPCNNRVIGLEQRPIALQDRGDGWAVPVDPTALSNFANVAVCPVEAASHDLDQFTFDVEVRITDGMGVTIAELAAPFRPTCAEDDTYCQCECDIDPGADCAIDKADASPDCPAQDASPI